MRIIHLRRPHFFKSCARHAPRNSPRYRAVCRTIRQLADDPSLPGPHDEPALLPPMVPCFARPVAGAPIAVCFTFDEIAVHILAVMPSQ